MSLWSIDGNRPTLDVRQDRIAAGTLGGEHMVPRSIGGKKVSGVIDDSDPRIIYGYAAGYGVSSGTFSFYATTDFVYGGTQTVVGGLTGTGTPGSAAQITFKGTSIGVLGSFNPDSGTMRIYIDGVETKGRLPNYTGIKLPSSYANPIITATATSIPALNTASFPSSGYIYLGGEVIQYASKTGISFDGCTRGTAATIHNANETIYLWDSSIGLYSAGYGSRQILYYNPLLSEGSHTITIIAETNATSGNARIYFDGFVTGSLIGATNVLTQLATFSFTGVATDGNGHVDLGGFVANNNDIARLSLLGYSQTNCETTNTTIMGTLGVRYGTDGQVFYYLHNGPISATINIILSFAFIGETI